jgi:hypothetical protein
MTLLLGPKSENALVRFSLSSFEFASIQGATPLFCPNLIDNRKRIAPLQQIQEIRGLT